MPTSVLPVIAILATCGCFTSASPSGAPEPVTQLTTPAGNPPSDQRRAKGERRERRHRRRLHHHGAAGGERRPEFPAQQRNRIIPRRDQPADADGLISDPRAIGPVLGRIGPAFDAHAFGRVVVDGVARADDFAHAIGRAVCPVRASSAARSRPPWSGTSAEALRMISRARSCQRAPLLNAACAAGTAASRSAAVAHGTVPTTRPSCGERTSMRAPSPAARCCVVDEQFAMQRFGHAWGRMQTLSASPLSMSGNASLMRSSGRWCVMILSAGKRPLCSSANAAWKSLFFSE